MLEGKKNIWKFPWNFYSGTFSEIRLAVHLHEKKEYAIKVINKKKIDKNMLDQIR